MSMTTIYLLRHGALAADARDRFVGQIDLPLSPEGLLQAETLGEVLRPLDIDTVFCSDLLRSLQTAQAIVDATNIPIEVRRDLREIALGDWEGLSRQDVMSGFPAQYAARGADIARYRIPGGESFTDCQARVLAAWQDIVERGAKRIVIVGHAGANRALLCHLLNLPLAGLFSLEQQYGAVNVIERQGGRCHVRLIDGHPADLCVSRLRSPRRTLHRMNHERISS